MSARPGPGPVLLVEESDLTVVVRINRPDHANALDGAVINGLNEVLDEIEDRPRFLVLTGGSDGRFVGGTDLAHLAARRFHEGLTGPVVRLLDRLERAPLPTVAAVDGPAVGGGAELAYACDVRVVTPRTYFAQPEVRLGLTAGAGATWRLPQLVGKSLAVQMVLCGKRLDAAAALAAGLAMEVVDPPELLPRALALVEEMSTFSTAALRLAKLSLHAPSTAHPAVDLVAQALLVEHPETQARLDTARAPRSPRGVRP